MFEVFELPNFPVPYPCRSMGVFKIDQLLELGFSIDEILDALDGKIIRDEYVIDFAPAFLRKLRIDQLVNDYPDGMADEDIASSLQITYNNVQVIRCNAVEKLRKRGLLRSFLENVNELRKLRTKTKRYEFTFSGKVTIKIE